MLTYSSKKLSVVRCMWWSVSSAGLLNVSSYCFPRGQLVLRDELIRGVSSSRQ